MCFRGGEPGWRRFLLTLACAALLTGGCAAERVENPFEIGAEEYHHIFEASVEVLREHRFRVDRQDRRFGVVTTRTRTAGSVFEPWHGERATAYQTAENTLNHQRRHVRVQIRPVEAADGADADGEADAEEQAAEEAGARATLAGPSEVYEVQVQVFLERRQHPPRVLNSGALVEVDLRRRPQMHLPVVTEEGLIESEWRPLRRDHHMEQQLVAAIIRRSIEIEPRHPPRAEGQTLGDVSLCTAFAVD